MSPWHNIKCVLCSISGISGGDYLPPPPVPVMMDCPGSKSLAIHPPLQCGVWHGVFRHCRGAAERDGSCSLLQLVCTRRRFAVAVWREMQMEGEEVIFYWRSRLTNSHYADVLHRLRSLQSVQPRNQHEGFFFNFMECPRLLFTNRRKYQKLIEKRWKKNIALQPLIPVWRTGVG